MATRSKKSPISTLIIWNDKQIVIRRVPSVAAEIVSDEIRNRLHHGDVDDPRWQIMDADLMIDIDE